MKGRHIISIISRKASYQLTLERKISVLKGNSGTGKSSVIRLISEYLEYGKKSGVKVTIDSSASLKVLNNSSDWVKELSAACDTIFFIDEDVYYLYTEGFQKELWQSDCYVLIVSRSGMLTGIPYSVRGIYEFVTEKKGENTATSMYCLYEESYRESKFDFVLTEDTNSGFEMAKYAFGEAKVYSSGGNTAILTDLAKEANSFEQGCVSVDGAAFGAFVEPVLKYTEIKENVMVAAPESFEYIILNFNEIKKHLSSDYGELFRTYDFCEVSKYCTWEQYYTQLLAYVTSEHMGFVYSKKKLNPWFMNENIAKQYINLLCQFFVRRRR